MKKPSSNIEVRAVSFDDVARIESETENAPRRVVGYAAKFGVVSEIIAGVFRETIAPGAFKRDLQGSDVRLLMNHDPGKLLARTKSGTLKLSEDNVGLRFEAVLPETSLVRDMVEQIRRGDLDSMSFGFKTLDESWGEDENGFPLRTLLRVKLFDISLATFPAYPETEVALRELAEYQKTRKTSHFHRMRLRLRLAAEEASI